MLEPITWSHLAAKKSRKIVYLDFSVGRWDSQCVELFKYDVNVKKSFGVTKKRQMSTTGSIDWLQIWT